ncbi:CrcB family protein [Actinoplanes sp. LDG1-06]|uniref:Fluoride-specific ion channel FluC n=1 Tax=Paractinoplanes ovalisporus TaxID=2810368 RepID=A0ABS2AE78_9ACTN|nr:CrcB family protein [Actinoplanes ovalisporus]MBM2618135.1 CrcB family protein [Actinoplanes ovalisporus]
MDGRTIGAISAGGVLGALARYALNVALQHEPGGFPWATWLINISGCFLIGALVAWIARFRPQQRYLRPFLGTGFLGGYTTFSTAMTDVLGSPAVVALVYFATTVIGALLAVWAGTALATRVPR